MSTATRPLPEEGFLRRRLAVLRRRLRLVAICRGVGWVLALLVLVAAVDGYLDWKLKLPDLVRASALVVTLAGAVVLAFRYLYGPLSARSDDLSLALRVEERYPILNDSLASAIEFLNQPEPPTGESVPVRREAIRRALGRAKGFDFNGVVDSRDLYLSGGVAVSALALAVTLLILFPATASTALMRLAVPFGTTDWPRRTTQLELVEPRTRIGKTETFELSGVVKGAIPADAAIVLHMHTETASEKSKQSTPLEREGDHANLSWKWVPPEEVSRFTVKVIAGDAESKEFEVEVAPLPQLAKLGGDSAPRVGPSLIVRLDVPRYTDLPMVPRRLERGDFVEAMAARAVPRAGSIEQWLPPGVRNIDECYAGTVVNLFAAADRPLARAWIQYVPEDARAPMPPVAGGKIDQPQIDAVLEDDATHFTIRFTPQQKGVYLLTLEDKTGLRSKPPIPIDVNLIPDPAPSVFLRRPSVERDFLSVLPNAKMTLHIDARDPIFALRSIFLRYRIEGEDAPRNRVYYDHATAAAKLFAPAVGTAMLAAPPRLRPKQLEIEMPLPIAQFKHRDGMPLRPGDVLILQACADDFDDVTANKAPGVSTPELRILIVDPSGFERDLNKQLTIIQNILAEQRDKEQAAVQEVTRAENRLKQGEKPTSTEMKQLDDAEKVQRELRDRFGEKQDELRAKVRRIQDSLKENGMPNSPVRDRMRHVEQELKRLAENDLVQAEQQLATAKQQLERSAQSEDRARAARQEATEHQLRAANLNEEAAKMDKDAAKTDDPPAKEKLLDDARQARRQAEDERKQAEAILQRQQADDAKRDRAKEKEQETKARESIQAARRRQEEVTKTLNDLLARLEPSSVVGEIKGEARDLLDAQRELEARVKKMEEKTRGKNPDELTMEEREELKAAREAQQELEDRSAKLLERMRQEAERRAKTEPELVEKLKDAVKQAEQENVLGEMRDAREKLDKNQLNDAGKKQKAAAAGLENLVRKLGRQTEAEQDQLVKKLRQAEKELEKMRTEQEELRKKMKELKEGKGGLNEMEREEELKRLAKRQEELQQQEQELAKRLSREGRADRARQALDKAAKNPDDMLDRLNEAERELKRARQQEQEILEREQLTRILEVIERLRDRQAALNAEAERLRKEVKEEGKWTRSKRDSLVDLREAQKGLRAETEKIIPEELANTPVFARMLQRSAEAMELAEKRITELIQEVVPADASPDKLPDAELTKQQKQALQRLERVIDAVKSQLDAPPPPQSKQPKNPENGDPPDNGSPPPQNGLPPLAQLKLLKALQQDVYARSEEFHKAHPDLNKLSEAEKTEYNSIIRDQQDVRELLEEMRRPPGEPAGDKGAEPKPEEGMKK